MSEDAPPGPHAMPVTYDLLKHTTTVALIGIGGVLGLLSGDGPRLDGMVVLIVVLLLGFGGASALGGMQTLARSEDASPLPVEVMRRKLRRQQTLSVGMVMTGLGMFMGFFVMTLIEMKK